MSFKIYMGNYIFFLMKNVRNSQFQTDFMQKIYNLDI
jgi:hypothetical protein